LNAVRPNVRSAATPGAAALVCQRADSATVKAIARAFRWREMLESGTHATIAEITAGLAS
jgi:Na+/H+ antiporter NhaA